MTSRELTSGINFWSRGHLRMAVVYLSRVIDIFSDFKMAAAAILDLLVNLVCAIGTRTNANSWYVPPVKIS